MLKKTKKRGKKSKNGVENLKIIKVKNKGFKEDDENFEIGSPDGDKEFRVQPVEIELKKNTSSSNGEEMDKKEVNIKKNEENLEV